MTTDNETTIDTAAEPKVAPASKATKPARAKRPAKAAPAKAKPSKATKGKRITRGARLLELLARPEGVSIEELQKEFGTKVHTIRAQISVETRKAGVKVTLADGRYTATA